MKRVLFILLFISFSFSQDYIDIVTLKNGDILKGKIIENKIDDYIKIELYGGSILTYNYDLILIIESKKNEVRTFGGNKVYTNSQSYSNQPVIANCFNDGYKSGRAINTQGAMWGGFGSGLIFGLIGMGGAYAVVSSQNPIPPTHEINSIDINCQSQYLEGYKEGALKVRKSSNLLGGALGTLTLLIIVIDAQTSYYYY